MGGGGGGGGIGGAVGKVANPVKSTVYDPVARGVEGVLAPVTSPFGQAWEGIRGAPERWRGGMHNPSGGGGGGGGGIDAGPRPELGNRVDITDASGNLNANFRLNPEMGNQAAFNKLQQRATQEGPSPWLQMQMQQLQRQTMDQQNAAARGAAGAAAQSRANLAMKGGLSGGAAERMARSGVQDLNARRQDIANQKAQQAITLGAQDEATKTGLLKDATSANLAQQQYQTDVNKYNIGNMMNDTSAKNAWKQTEYQEKMKGYGAANTANAIAAGGGGKK